MFYDGFVSVYTSGHSYIRTVTCATFNHNCESIRLPIPIFTLDRVIGPCGVITIYLMTRRLLSGHTNHPAVNPTLMIHYFWSLSGHTNLPAVNQTLMTHPSVTVRTFQPSCSQSNSYDTIFLVTVRTYQPSCSQSDSHDTSFGYCPDIPTFL